MARESANNAGSSSRCVAPGPWVVSRGTVCESPPSAITPTPRLLPSVCRFNNDSLPVGVTGKVAAAVIKDFAVMTTVYDQSRPASSYRSIASPPAECMGLDSYRDVATGGCYNQNCLLCYEMLLECGSGPDPGHAHCGGLYGAAYLAMTDRAGVSANAQCRPRIRRPAAKGHGVGVPCPGPIRTSQSTMTGAPRNRERGAPRQFALTALAPRSLPHSSARSSRHTRSPGRSPCSE
jgi:hypothetical protein